jgi:hypothetical protein
MSNKPTPATATEPNKPGLPDSPERGTGDAHSVAGQAAVAGTGVQGVIPEEVIENEAVVSGRASPKAKKTEPQKSAMAWFRVKGPGSVKVNGAWLAPGAEIKLGRAEALSVDECLEEIDSPS